MAITELDRLDKLVLHELDINARQPLSRIAKRLRLGSDLIEYRVDKFVQQGIVKRFTPLIEPSALGLGLYKTYLKHKMPKARLKQFIGEVNRHPMTYWLCEGYGAWDILFTIASRGAVKFQDAHDKLLSKYGEDILDIAVYTPTEVVRFPKHYLKGKGSTTFRWQRTKSEKELGELERRILNVLSENCRISTTDLAAQLDITPAIATYRIKQMEEQGAILGYRTQLDYKTIGMMVFKVFLEVRQYSPKLRKEILDYCKNQLHITCFIQQIGSAPIEFEIEVSDYYHFSELIEEFKGLFGDRLGRIQYMLIKEDHFHRIPNTI